MPAGLQPQDLALADPLAELGVQLSYPSYREGLAAIVAGKASE